MKKYKLGEICENITDGEHGTVVDSPDGEYFLLSNKNIVDGKIVINTTTDRRIDKQTFEKINKRTKLEKNDVLISTVGTLGKLCIVEDNLNYTVQRSVGIIKPNQEKLKSIFLKYLLMTDSYQNLLKNTSKGAIQKCIFIDDLKSLELSIPDISTQQKIASVLSTLDEKIALNRRINAKLEQMAKCLYDYWFVQFDFPDENGSPYKSSGGKMVYNAELKREIPAGWGVKSIFDSADVIYGFPYATEPFDESVENSENPYSVIRIRDILENTVSAKTTEESDEKYKTQVGDLLIGMDGYFHMNFWSRNDDYVNQRITRIRKTCISTLILYHQILPFVKFKEEKAKGSTVGHLSDKDIRQIKVLIPDNKNLSDKFDLILDLMMKNRQENVKLSKMRDGLLPLLMNGQVEVK